MLTFHAVGRWMPGQIQVRWVSSSRRIIPPVERAIETAWEITSRRPGVKLFDGPMCRLERWNATDHLLELDLSQISYKPFFGTNLSHPEFAEKYGREVMANPVGVSPALQSADGYVLLGKRNASVAYYPNRTHPFAGALEPGDQGDLFAAVGRELFEELSMRPEDIAEIACTGIVEDRALRQPELLFAVKSTLNRAQIEAQVHAEEHRDSVAISAVPEEVRRAISKPSLTPVAVASLLLWGRIEFGQEWFSNSVASIDTATQN